MTALARTSSYSKLQTRFLVREDTLIAKRRNERRRARLNLVKGPKGRPDTQTYWSTDCRPQEELQLQLQLLARLCGLVVRVPGYTTEMYCASCGVQTEFMYVM
jgi:hypothetical protein